MAPTPSQSAEQRATTIIIPTRVRKSRLNGSDVQGSRGSGRKGRGDFYILASAMSSRRTTRVLAQGESFAIFEAAGDVVDSPLEALGFFHRDTRHLNCFEITIAGEA
ncbi:MAG TPA: glycogen debranching N-terminal domain-containing protein, partial [Candidatus Binataceae bacterium]|nr:glycogen debranching N-terminal domain-containing protein [Candidatus Binataceae bacterium]